MPSFGWTGESPLSVTCNKISTEQVAEIFKTSNQTEKIANFHLIATTTLGEVHIPANFLSYRIITWVLTLECLIRINDKNGNEPVPIIIDPNAFKSSFNDLNQLIISNCDLGRLDFSFLAGFTQLNQLKIENPFSISNIKWDRMPKLSSLNKIEMFTDKQFEIDWTIYAYDLKDLLNTDPSGNSALQILIVCKPCDFSRIY